MVWRNYTLKVVDKYCKKPILMQAGITQEPVQMPWPSHSAQITKKNISLHADQVTLEKRKKKKKIWPNNLMMLLLLGEFIHVWTSTSN